MTDLTAEKQELFERRIQENVEKKLSASLFKLYSLIGVAVSGVLGLVGYNLISEAKKSAQLEISEAITTEKNKIDDFKKETFETYQSYFKKLQNDIEISQQNIGLNLKNSQWIATRINEKLLQLETVAESVEPKAMQLKQFTQETQEAIDKISTNIKNIESDVATRTEIPDRLDQLAVDLKNLADRVKELAAPIAGPEQNSKIAGSAQSTSDSAKEISEKIRSDQKRPVVFLQYYAMPKPTAEGIARNLRYQGLVVPGIDEEPMSRAGQRMVRYYHREDEATANEVAKAAERALASVALQPSPIPVENYSMWRKAKPKPGIVELWLGESAPVE